MTQARPSPRIVSAWFPDLPMDRWRAIVQKDRTVPGHDVPVVLATDGTHGPVVHAASAAARARDDAAVYVVDDDVDDLINRGMVFCPGYWHYDWHGPWHSKLMVFCILLCVGLDLSLLESRAAAASFLDLSTASWRRRSSLAAASLASFSWTGNTSTTRQRTRPHNCFNTSASCSCTPAS